MKDLKLHCEELEQRIAPALLSNTGIGEGGYSGQGEATVDDAAIAADGADNVRVVVP